MINVLASSLPLAATPPPQLYYNQDGQQQLQQQQQDPGQWQHPGEYIEGDSSGHPGKGHGQAQGLGGGHSGTHGSLPGGKRWRGEGYEEEGGNEGRQVGGGGWPGGQRGDGVPKRARLGPAPGDDFSDPACPRYEGEGFT